LTKDDFFYKKEKQFLISRASLAAEKKLYYNDCNSRVSEKMDLSTRLALKKNEKLYIYILSHVFHLN
jgi:hypothetical protein